MFENLLKELDKLFPKKLNAELLIHIEEKDKYTNALQNYIKEIKTSTMVIMDITEEPTYISSIVMPQGLKITLKIKE